MPRGAFPKTTDITHGVFMRTVPMIKVINTDFADDSGSDLKVRLKYGGSILCSDILGALQLKARGPLRHVNAYWLKKACIKF